MRARVPWFLLARVVEDDVERAAVVRDSRDRLGHLVLRRQQQHCGVEILRARSGGLCDPLHAGNDAPRGVQHRAEQIHDDRKDHCEQDDVSDPPEDHFGLLSATIAAFLAIPGSAPRMMSNCALIALTAPSSGRRCCDSTPSSADASVASPSEILVRPRRTSISAAASTSTTPAASTTLKKASAWVVLMPHHRSRRSTHSYSRLEQRPPRRSVPARALSPRVAGYWRCSRQPWPRPRAARQQSARCDRPRSGAPSAESRRRPPLPGRSPRLSPSTCVPTMPRARVSFSDRHLSK